MQSPLKEQTVVLTRPAHANMKLVKAVEDRGGRPLIVPFTEVQKVVGEKEVENRLGALCNYDLVVFTSQNAVQFFLHDHQGFIERKKIKLPQVACVGRKTAQQVKSFGISDVLTPFRPNAAEELLQEIGRQIPTPAKILYPKAQETRDVLTQGLRGLGYRVDEWVLYCTKGVDAAFSKLKQNVRNGNGKVWLTFFSSSAVDALFSRSPEEEVQDWIQEKNIRIASIGQITTAQLRSYHMNVDVCPDSPGGLELIEAIEKYLSQ